MAQRPPHYLTEVEFENLRLTDAQWESIRKRLDAHDEVNLRDERVEQAKLRQKEAEADRVVRSGFAALLGLLLLGIVSWIIGMIADREAWGLMREPMAFLLATVVAAFLMRKR